MDFLVLNDALRITPFGICEFGATLTEDCLARCFDFHPSCTCVTQGKPCPSKYTELFN